MKTIQKAVFVSVCAVALGLSVGSSNFTKKIAASNTKVTQDELLGGDGTVENETALAFSQPARNISQHNKVSFRVGNSLFNENWVSSPASVKSLQGLGPLFNAESCSSCHLKDGRGKPPEKSDEAIEGFLVRLSGADNYGGQFNQLAIEGVPSEGKLTVEWENVIFNGANLVKPKLKFSNLRYGKFPAGVQFSPRVAPQVYGLGLLEAVPTETLLAFADESDKNSDGISGRPNYVKEISTGNIKIGRFGWKANQPSVAQQNFSAFLGDMGITSKFQPWQPCSDFQKKCVKVGKKFENGFEISEADLKHVEIYMKTLAVPQQRILESTKEDLFAGEKLFAEAKCSSCHVEKMVTGVDADFPENSNQVIRPYTDLLLHDMGLQLADGRPDERATGTEWRTPPLWGIGLVETVNGHTRFLHDGRARNIEEAILWHGGEAQKSAEFFVGLLPAQKKQFLMFLDSL